MSDLEHGSTVGGSPIVTQRNYPNHQHNAEDIRQLGNSALYDKSDSYGSDDTESIATSKALYDLREEIANQYMEDSGFNVTQLSSLPDNRTDVILILCPEGSGDYESMGSVYIQRSSGNRSVRKIDLLYSSTSSSNAYNYNAVLDYVLSDQVSTSETWDLVRFHYNGTNYIGLRRTGGDYWYTSAYYVGNNTWGGDLALQWVSTTSATSVQTLNYREPKYVSNGLPEFKVRAWGNFNGSNNVIRGGGNFSHVHRLSTGRWRVFFDTPMPDSNYSVTLGNAQNTTSAGGTADGHNCHTFSRESFIIETGQTSTLGHNNALVCFQVVR